MSDSHIPTLQLSPTDIEEMRSELEKAFPQKDELFYAYAVSQEICLRLLGPDWWLRCLATDSPSDDFLRHQPTDLRESFEHTHRVIELGNLLTELRDVDGYEHMVRGLRTRTLLGAVTELRVAKLLRTGGNAVRFNDIRSEIDGRSYDMEVDIGGKQALFVEVKAKEDRAPCTEGSLKNAVRSAGKQLPKEGPGLVVILIPESWTSDQDCARLVDKCVRDLLRNSRRLNGITLTWERTVLAKPNGPALILKMFKHFLNHHPRTPVPGLERLIRGLLRG